MKHPVGKHKPVLHQGSTPRLIFYATCSGGTTLDVDANGGNPFASALIEAAGERELQLRDLPARLHELTAAKSHEHQFTEVFGDVSFQNWSFHDTVGTSKEKRESLILVVSDYSDFGLWSSLIGAARDERRIAAMLAQCGFSVVQRVAPTRSALVQALVSFKRRSLRSEISVIYSTGHGLEFDGEVYLLPGDYPVHRGFGGAQLKIHAVSVTQIASAACAPKQNLIFFAGCREHVLPRSTAPPNAGMQPTSK